MILEESNRNPTGDLILQWGEIKDSIRYILFRVILRGLGARAGSRGLLFLKEEAGKDRDQRRTVKIGGSADRMS